MGKPKDAAKAAKKAAKTDAKLQKKLAKSGAGAPGSSSSDASSAPVATGSGSTPAERSAVAAERQAKLQQYRVWLGLAMALITLITLLATVQPWKYLGTPEAPSEPTPAVRP